VGGSHVMMLQVQFHVSELLSLICFPCGMVVVPVSSNWKGGQSRCLPPVSNGSKCQRK
jgi:hypothetical protein